MAIMMQNASRIPTRSSGIPFVGDKFTMSVYVRIDNRPTTGDHQIMGRGPCYIQASGNGGSTYNLRVQCRTADGVTNYTTKSGAAVGSVYHVIFVYDKDDASRRFIAVNASKVMWSAAGVGSLASLNSIAYGTSNVDMTIQRAFSLDGYAATDDDVFALADHIDTAPTIFAKGLASATGVIGFYHSMEGPIGVDVQQDDPGVTYGDPAVYGIGAPVRSTAESVVRYVEDMACNSAVAVERAYIGSSGRTLTVVVGSGTVAGRMRPLTSGLSAPLSIRVDGGEPIALPTALVGGTYAETSADGIFVPLPVTVAPTSVVTLDAPLNWLTPKFGYLPHLTAYPVANYAGKPISEGLWPDAKPTRVGINTSVYDPAYPAPNVIHKNRALSVGNGATGAMWPDGSIKGNFTGILTYSGGSNNADLVGTLGRSGKYVIRWDDYDPAKPVTMALSADNNTVVTELDTYRNYGDSQGRGKVRVYDVQFITPVTITLRGAIDATTTTIPYVEANHRQSHVLEIGGEQIRLNTYNWSSRTYTNCTRGWNGTAAAPHADGATGTARTLRAWGSILLSIRSDDAATTRYANFAAYDPGSWVEPETNGPLSLPPPDNLALDPIFQARWGPGVGAYRPMSGSQGSHYTDIDQPEQLARLEYSQFAARQYTEKLYVSSIRPYDPVASPYYYSHIPTANSETYTAVLGAPITTVPKQGTIETITITNGRDTPVIYGQVLFAGDEQMRVVKMPVSGDQYEVERGSAGTPTATHAVGPITVGYRIPVTQRNQYSPADQWPLHYYEMVFDETLSTPPRFGRSSAMAPWAGGDDTNIDARLTLTLSEPFSAKDVTMTVSTADPSDWDRIAKKLMVAIGSEVLTVLSVDRPNKKITVAARPSGASAYAAGTIATTRSGGVLISDGTTAGYAGLMLGRSVMFPTGPGRALVIGSDTSAGVPVGSTAAFTQRFDAPNAFTTEVRTPDTLYPYEFMAAATAQLDKAWCWVNIPLRASDATVHAIAKATLDHFPSGRKVLFELGNECWNTAFYTFAVCFDVSAASGAAAGKIQDFMIVRSQSAFNVFKRVFEAAGRGDECVQVVAWQTGSDILKDCRRLGTDPDATAIAPYLNPPKTAAVGSVYAAVDNAQMCDFLTFQNYYELYTGRYREIAAAHLRSVTDHQTATGKRVMTCYYEGGLETIVSAGTPGDPDTAQLRQRDVVYDPAMYFCERDFYAAAGQIGGVDLYCQFDLAGGGQTRYWGLFRGPAQLPGYGDGRPGDVDNRVYTFKNPIDLTRGADAENRSVRGQAMLDHQAAFIASLNGLPIDPDPDPEDPDPVDPATSIKNQRARKLPLSRFRFSFR